MTNQSDEPTSDFRLAIALNDNTVDVKPLKLAANGKWSQVIESTTAEGGLLTAELVLKGDKGDLPYPDALAADNKAVAVLPKREPMPVLHMNSPGGNLFLQKVLEANPLVRLTTSRELPAQNGQPARSPFSIARRRRSCRPAAFSWWTRPGTATCGRSATSCKTRSSPNKTKNRR